MQLWHVFFDYVSTTPKKLTYYAVVSTKAVGVYTSWQQVLPLVHQVKNAKYQKFASSQEAYLFITEHSKGHLSLAPTQSLPQKNTNKQTLALSTPDIPILGLCVDAACNKNPGGDVEFRAVLLPDAQQIFSFGPLPGGTNNVGEFLAVYYGLLWISQSTKQDLPLFSDSVSGLSWAKKGKCNTTAVLGTELATMVSQAEEWFQYNQTYYLNCRKWLTKIWGEIPADYGRK